jgi:hypothetical protein
MRKAAAPVKARTNRAMRVGAVAATVAVAVLAHAGAASAATRGFQITNNSARDLQVAGATPVPEMICGGFSETDFTCVPASYDMEFGDRPADGSVLVRGQSQDWELKYSYNPADLYGLYYNYAATVTYKVVGGAGQVVVKIMTSNYANDSTCTIVSSKSLRTCTAAGRQITIQ